MINLIDFTDKNDHPFGNVQGRKTFQELLHYVDSHPDQKVFEISLADIKATDSSFPRESVISIIKQFRGERWFMLSGFNSLDLRDNWDYAAKAKEQTLIVMKDNEPTFIGHPLNDSVRELLLLVFKHGKITTPTASKALDISIPNASTRLKKLVSDGLILRTEETALSGGKEFIYSAPNCFA